MTTSREGSSLASTARALSLSTSTSLLSPLAGLVVAPLLARAFDPTDRGILAAAIAPSTLVLSVATLGLPEALIYFSAKFRWMARRLFVRAAAVALLFGLLCFLLTVDFIPQLSKGDKQLGQFIFVAGLLIIPALLANLVRATATGLHAWTTTALDRVLLAVLRVGLFLGFFLAGRLSLEVAVAISVLVPSIAALIYLPVLIRAEKMPVDGIAENVRMPTFLKYGLRVWAGSIASILLARVDQLLMTPLSSARDLGLYAVAVTISELPMVVNGALQSALFGLNSRERDANRLAFAGRVFFMVAGFGCLVVAVTLPLWIGLVFGQAYRAAVLPTILLIIGSVIIIPANSAGTALNAWGRPGLRSFTLLVTLVINLVLLFVLVPRYGIYGACYTSIIGSVVFSGLLIKFAARVTGLKAKEFLVPQRGDLTALLQVLKPIRARLLRRGDRQ